MEKYILELFEKLENKTIEPYEKEILADWVDSNSDFDFNPFLKGDKNQLLQKLKTTSAPTKPKIYKLYRWASVAASVLILFVFSFLHFTKENKILIHASNEVREIILPDQSVITLNQNSTLEYGSNFGDSNRDIKLIGSAYFDVTKNRELPFMIKTETSMTKVIGTAFYLEDYAQDSLVILDVDEGIVSIKVNEEDPVIKKIGEKYAYNKITKKASFYQKEINDKFWKTKNLVFEDTKLEQALSDISKAYKVTLSSNEDLSRCKLTSVFKEEKLQDILDILAITYQGKWINSTPSTFELINTKCK